MKTNTVFLLLLCLLAWPLCCRAQGYISYDYLPASSLRDDFGSRYGSGSLMMLSGGYNLPLSAKQDYQGRPVVWSATLRVMYGIYDNRGEAENLIPNNILNAGLNITHLRPLFDKWSIIAFVGGGVYAPLKAISMKTLLANGGVLFVYKLRDNLDLGIGAGITNSYGIPMILPMMYLRWRSTGRYELKIDMSNGMKISAATRLNKRLKLELAAIDIDGMSAVEKVDGQAKIYSTVLLRSYLSPSYRLNSRTDIYIGIGGNWIRGSNRSDRSLKGFIQHFKDDGDELHFGPTLRLTAGFKYSF